MPKNPLFF